MKKQVKLPVPVLRTLRKMGQDISDARRRRRITMALMAERAGVSRATMSKIEKGDPSVSMGGYGAVLFVLGMVGRLSDLADASYDLTGLRLEEEHLPKRVRLSKNRQKREHNGE